LGLDDRIWSATTFTKNRDRLLDGDIAAAFFEAVLIHADAKQLLSHEHFTVDGTLLEAWASHKSFQRKDGPPPPSPDGGGNPTIDFKGERRSNVTHQSTTDPDARLYRKGRQREARLGYLGHVVMENRSGLLVDALLTPATGTAEREASLVMISRRPGDHRISVGSDKGYDTRAYVDEMRHLGATPHVAQCAPDSRRGSAIDARTTRHPGYAISQRKRKLVEQAFGWMKTVALLRKVRHRGGARVERIFTFAATAYNWSGCARCLRRPPREHRHRELHGGHTTRTRRTQPSARDRCADLIVMELTFSATC
jgi:hypothetical protein